jgi:hypothetical protein
MSMLDFTPDCNFAGSAAYAWGRAEGERDESPQLVGRSFSLRRDNPSVRRAIMFVITNRL